MLWCRSLYRDSYNFFIQLLSALQHSEHPFSSCPHSSHIIGNVLSSVSGLWGSYCILSWVSFKNWFSRCNSMIFTVSSARVSSSAQFAAAACWANVSTIAIIFAICSWIEWSSKLSTAETTFLAGAIAFRLNFLTDGANYWCEKSNKRTNNKQLP